MVNPTELDDLDLKVLSEFANFSFKTEQKEQLKEQNLQTWVGSMFAGLEEFARRLGYELRFEDDPDEQKVAEIRKEIQRRDTFGWSDMRLGYPKFSRG